VFSWVIKYQLYHLRPFLTCLPVSFFFTPFTMVNFVKIASVTLSLGSHVARQNNSCPASPVCPTHNGCISYSTRLAFSALI
jgi:hypothetical protein